VPEGQVALRKVIGRARARRNSEVPLVRISLNTIAKSNNRVHDLHGTVIPLPRK
jgi:hypothetical protein